MTDQIAEPDATGLNELQALLGRGTEFEGKLAFEGRVRIDGKLRGHIVGAGLLILGPSAEIHADIDVETLIVRGGAIWGQVRALQLVELYAPARVYGDIVTAQLYLDKGVAFEGRCTMPDPPKP
jgi:cytoskeletal protein CcmA (bactofilin family)